MTKKDIKNDLETKELLISSAIQIISEKGYSKTTLEDIARNVNLTRGAFYWYFKNKKEILSEIERRYEENYLRDYGEFTIYESAYQTLYELVKHQISKIFNHNYIKTAILIRYNVEATTEFSDLMEKQKQVDQIGLNKILEQVQRGVDQKELKQDLNPRETAIYIFSYILGIENMRMLHDENDKLLEGFIIENYVDKIMNPLKL